METFDIEQKGVPVKQAKSGVFLTVPLLVTIGVITALVFTGSILATYFGKSCPDCNKDLSGRCGDYYCENRNILDDWNRRCPTTPATNASTINPTGPTPPPVNWRLPDALYPFHYDLTIQAYLRPTERPETYDGKEWIHFRALRDTDRLVFHSLGPVFNNATLRLESSTDTMFTPLSAFVWTYESVTSQVTVVLPNGRMFRASNDYAFYVEYQMTPGDNNRGFFRASYGDASGNRRWFMASHQTYTEARKGFPSFDEPGFKSTYKLTIIHDASVHAMSNMPIIRETTLPPSDGYNWIETEFNETVPMPTYLFALFISDFSCLNGVAHPPISANVNMSFCVRPQAINDIALAMDVAGDILEYFETYYDVAYTLPKLDHIGSPTLKSGAMENWGIVLYHESYFLHNQNSSQTTELNVVRVIAHEISHMWFGNLVTAKWWDDLWLNEGFATYAEYYGTDAVRKSWRMIDRYFEYLLGILQSDSSETSRAVSIDVLTSAEIDAGSSATFTYGKGSTIPKMLSYVLGEDTFKNGLNSYFEKFTYQNVDQYDLWDSLYEQATLEGKLRNVNFTNIMTSWANQKGHPVITIRRIGNNQIGVRQNRFILDILVDQSQLTDIKWHIPFTHSIETLGSTSSFTNQVTQYNLWDKVYWVPSDKAEEIITLNRPLGNNDFLIANLDMAGFYRVNYDPADWNLISQQLKNNKDQLSLRTRAALLCDALSLSQAGYFNGAPWAFQIGEYLANEDDYLPWTAFISRTTFFRNIFDSTSTFYKLQTYYATLSKLYHNKIGWVENVQTDLWTDRLIRSNLVNFACNNNLQDCVDTARMHFNNWVQTSDSDGFPRGFRALSLCTSVYSGSISDFNYVFDAARKTTDSSLQTDLYNALACSNNIVLIQSFLGDQLANTNRILTALVSVTNRPGGSLIAYEFLKANWDEIYSRYNTSGTFTTLIRDISLRLKYDYQLNDFNSFFAGKPLTNALQNALQDARKQIQQNIKWWNSNSAQLIQWFALNQPTNKPALRNESDLVELKVEIPLMID